MLQGAGQGAPQAARGPTEGWKGLASGETRQDTSMGSWNLGELNSEAMMVEAGQEEGTLKRRTRRTHCGWPCCASDAMGRCMAVSVFGFVRFGHKGAERCHRGC